MSLRLAFAGTPEFAAHALRALLGSAHHVVGVLTQPDRPSGRGLQLQPSAVKQVALAHGLPVLQPRGLRLDGRWAAEAASAQTQLTAWGADALVVAAYGLILPDWTLALPRLGCLNIHASLLPRWRGAAPIQRAIEAGDAETGVTLMQMDAGLDTGAILAQVRCPIAPTDNAANVHDRLAEMGAQATLHVLTQAERGALQPQPQPSAGVSYAAKLDKAEAALDWQQPAVSLVRRILAFNPVPGAHTLWHGPSDPVPLKVWGARLGSGHPGTAPCGQILAVTHDGLAVAAIDSIAILTHLQRPGGKRLDAAVLARGLGLQVGQRLGPA